VVDSFATTLLELEVGTNPLGLGKEMEGLPFILCEVVESLLISGANFGLKAPFLTVKDGDDTVETVSPISLAIPASARR